MAQYKVTLTSLRNNIEDIRDVMNNNNLDGNTTMSTWDDQIDAALKKKDKLQQQVDTLTEKNEYYQERNKELYNENTTLTSENNTLQQANSRLESENETLENQIQQDNNNWDDVYDALVEKNSPPSNKNDHSTYDDAVRAIESGGETADYEIGDAEYLFEYTRYKLFNQWYPKIKNCRSWENAFKGASLGDITELELDLASKSNSTASAFQLLNMAYIFIFDNRDTDVTIRIKANAYQLRGLFYSFNYFLQGIAPYVGDGNINIIVDLDENNNKVKDMSYMLHHAHRIKSFKINNVDFSELNNVQGMFQGINACTNSGETPGIKDIDLSNLGIDWSKVTYMQYMFSSLDDSYSIHYDSAIKSVNFGDDVVFKDNNMNFTFKDCSKLTSVKFSIKDTQNTSMQTNKTSMFEGCSNLEYVYPAESEPIWTVTSTMGNMFKGCTKLKDIPQINIIATYEYQNILNLSDSPQFKIQDYLTKITANTSGYTYTIKLHPTVYSSLSEESQRLAAEKNYTLAQ